MESTSKTSQSLNNNLKYQQFTLLDTISVYGLIGVVTILIASIVSNALAQDKGHAAKLKAEQLALQIMAREFKVSDLGNDNFNNKTKRKIANESSSILKTEGRIGIDPWGQPYYYYSYVNEVNHKRAVAVISSGANQRPESEIEQRSGDSTGRIARFGLRGDDVGSIKFE